MSTKWEKLEPLKGRISGCLHCGYTEGKASMKTKVIAGFGEAIIKKDSEFIYQALYDLEWKDAFTLQKFENMARKDPNHDWRFELILPLREAEYQRQGDNNWVLVKVGEGFA